MVAALMVASPSLTLSSGVRISTPGGVAAPAIPSDAFAAVRGGPLGADKTCDYRKLFSEWWRGEWSRSSYKIPDEGLVFDYYVDAETKKPTHWREVVPRYVAPVLGETFAFASIVVRTVHSTRLNRLVGTLAAHRHPVMLVGGAGSAKKVVYSERSAQKMP